MSPIFGAKKVRSLASLCYTGISEMTFAHDRRGHPLSILTKPHASGFGDDYCKLGDYAWYVKNSDNKTHAVGQKKPNARGLYDMHGKAPDRTRTWADNPASCGNSARLSPLGVFRSGDKPISGVLRGTGLHADCWRWSSAKGHPGNIG